MKLKIFIEKLVGISKEHGDELEVIMADAIPVVEPILSRDYPSGKSVVITDGGV